MIKASRLLFALVATTLSAPQNRRYDSPRPSGNQYHRQDSGERFSGGSGFDSREKFSAGGFRQASGHRFPGSSSERFGGGFSGEVRDGGFAPQPVGGGFEVREEFSGPTRGGGGFVGGSRVSGGFGGYSGESFRSGPVIAILREERQDPINGEYSFLYETEDGVFRQESGSPVGPEGSTVQQGSWTFTYPDGTPADFRFVADENGYQVESNLLPTPHPLPAHAIAQIEKAERERAAGIIHDGQYREEDHFGGGLAPQPGRFSPGPSPVPASGPGPFRSSGQGFQRGFDDSSLERPTSFRSGDDRYQSSFETDHFPQQFGGGLQPQPVGKRNIFTFRGR
ncbi:Cuticle protein [Armadillidium vulgare]|nr:Cuticle protein [Armadillidium vulgare]